MSPLFYPVSRSFYPVSRSLPRVSIVIARLSIVLARVSIALAHVLIVLACLSIILPSVSIVLASIILARALIILARVPIILSRSFCASVLIVSVLVLLVLILRTQFQRLQQTSAVIQRSRCSQPFSKLQYERKTSSEFQCLLANLIKTSLFIFLFAFSCFSFISCCFEFQHGIELVRINKIT